jgi:hypothetical protein
MNIKLFRCLTMTGWMVFLMGCAGPKTTAPSVRSGTTIPELSECRLQLKDLEGEFGLVEVPGSQFKQMSLVGAKFDQGASYFQCGVRRARLRQSGHSFEVAEPITFQMTSSDPLTYAKEWSGVVPKSESVLWIEPGD